MNLKLQISNFKREGGAEFIPPEVKRSWCKFKNGKPITGFTVVEILVVVSIIIVFSIILTLNFPQVRPGFALSRTVYKFEQDLRRVQGMALSSTEYKDSGGVVQPIKGYGIYIDNLNNKQYVIYADKYPGNQKYDQEDYVVETIDFSVVESGIIIKEIQSIVDENNYVAIDNVSIDFAPPNPITTITPSTTYNRVHVVFAQEDKLTATGTVSANTAGLIEVK